MVEGLDIRVFVGFTDRQVPVDFVEGGHAFFADGVGGADGLAAAADTAAGAGHDFDKVIGTDTFFYLFHDGAGIFEGMGYGDMHLAVGQAYGGFFDAVKAAYIHEFDFFEGLAGDFFVDGAQGCFHHAAGSAEDGAGAGGEAQGTVKVVFRQFADGQAYVFDEFDELAGGQHNVHIAVAVAAHFGAGGLKFFGGAGHDGDGDDFLWRKPCFFGVVGFGDGAEHAHGGFGRGKVVYAGGEVFFHVVDPAGAAGGHHGQYAAVFQTVQEFVAFFHDG